MTEQICKISTKSFNFFGDFCLEIKKQKFMFPMEDISERKLHSFGKRFFITCSRLTLWLLLSIFITQSVENVSRETKMGTNPKKT